MLMLMRSVADLQNETVDFFDGKGGNQLYEAGIADLEDWRTAEQATLFSRLNRAGFVTVDSQPGSHCDVIEYGDHRMERDRLYFEQYYLPREMKLMPMAMESLAVQQAMYIAGFVHSGTVDMLFERLQGLPLFILFGEHTPSIGEDEYLFDWGVMDAESNQALTMQDVTSLRPAGLAFKARYVTGDGARITIRKSVNPKIDMPDYAERYAQEAPELYTDLAENYTTVMIMAKRLCEDYLEEVVDAMEEIHGPLYH